MILATSKPINDIQILLWILFFLSALICQVAINRLVETRRLQ